MEKNEENGIRNIYILLYGILYVEVASKWVEF